MNITQRVFDALDSMRGCYFTPHQINAMTRFGVLSIQNVLKRFHHDGMVTRERDPEVRRVAYRYALTAEAKRPEDMRTADGKRNHADRNKETA